MPFKIVRNDITKVKADAIVNTANPRPTYAAGTDAAVYAAAGADELLRERKKIGNIRRGEAVATSGFALPAKYIIHTVGPNWINGKHDEFETLASCYKNSLKLAEDLGCKSIAFPLISTGVYGFPKDKALGIAVSEISKFLDNSDMMVTLVVFDRKAFELSGKLSSEVDAYIDENYVSTKELAEYDDFDYDERRRREEEPVGYYVSRKWRQERSVGAKPTVPEMGSAAPEPVAIKREKVSKDAKTTPAALDKVVDNPGKSFQDRLFELIDESGLTDPQVYKKANISRKVFSSMHKADYQPKKSTAIAMAIALELDLEQTEDLLKRAGFALSPSNVSDLIVSYFISNKNYNMFDLNEALFAHGQPTIGC